MLRMEIALFLVLAFVAFIYFSAERRHTPLHRTFSLLLIVVLLLAKRRKKKKAEAEAQLALAEAAPQQPVPAPEGADIMEMQTEKSVELRQDVRKFAEDNPEIAAQMVKAWLKEGDGAE